MFRFDKEQEVLDIAGIKVGGQPGEYPTVLAGTIFYPGQDIYEDEEKDIFNKEKAEALIKLQEEMSDTTGNPCFVGIQAEDGEAMANHIDFIVEVTDVPFLIDSTVADARLYGAKHADEIGVADRAIYNSINMSIDDDEIAGLKDTDVSSAVVLGFNAQDPSVNGRIAIWEDGAGMIQKGLLDIAADCRIDKPLMDVAVTPLGAGAGHAVRTAFAVKSKWGYPVGSAIHNVPSAWDWIKDFRKEHREVWPVCDVGSNFIQQMTGSDWIFYGPIENVRMAFAGCAMTDIFITEAAMDLGTEPQTEDHPYYKLL